MVATSKVPASSIDADMAEQPAVLEGLLSRRTALAAELAPLRRRPVAGVLLAARGSSDNAATYGRYVLEAALGRPAALSANSLFTRYGCRTSLDGWLVIAVSQSGETTEITEVLEATRPLGARAVAITNDDRSSLALAADTVVGLEAGDERAVPATKTYTATLLALALLAELLGEAPWRPGTLEAMPALVDALLDDRNAAAEAATLLAKGQPSVHLGRGYLYCAALESALKLREAALLPVEGYANADFLHGPIAASGAETAALCHLGAGPTRADGEALAEVMRRRGSAIVACGSDLARLKPDAALRVPAVEESVAALVHAVRGQQLAVDVALARGLDPDRPAGLSKVTRT